MGIINWNFQTVCSFRRNLQMVKEIKERCSLAWLDWKKNYFSWRISRYRKSHKWFSINSITASSPSSSSASRQNLQQFNSTERSNECLLTYLIKSPFPIEENKNLQHFSLSRKRFFNEPLFSTSWASSMATGRMKDEKNVSILAILSFHRLLSQL